MPTNQQTDAIFMIRNPTGPFSPYDFKTPENVAGFLNEDRKDDKRAIVVELRGIVNEVLEGNSPQFVSIPWRTFRHLDEAVWAVISEFDGVLTLRGIQELTHFFQNALRAKYEGKGNGEYIDPVYTYPESLK